VRRFGLIAPVAFVVALAPAARAEDKPAADWKWDPHEWSRALVQDRTFAVGDRFVTESHETEMRKLKITSPSGKEKNDDLNAEATCKYVEEILEVADGKVKKSKVTFEKWRLERNGAKDTILQGKTVLLTVEGDQTTTKVEGEDPSVSAAASAWLRKNFTRGKRTPADEKKDEAVFPTAAIAPDTEWKIDPEKVSVAMFGPDAKVDPDKSRATGKLAKVRLVDGVPFGEITITLELQLKLLPRTTVPWTEGGAFKITMLYDGSLVEKRFHKDETVTMIVSGKAILEEGPEAGDLDMKIDNKKTEKTAKAK
jgi:hypothetical protein